METVFGLFDTYAEARKAVAALLEQGYDAEEMNVIVEANVADTAMDVNEARVDVKVTDEVGEQELHGLDRLVGGQQAVSGPAMGPVYAAGDGATLLIKMALTPRAAGSGLAQGLEETGVPADVAATYAEDVRGGSILFWITVPDERLTEAVNLLKTYKGKYVERYPE